MRMLNAVGVAICCLSLTCLSASAQEGDKSGAGGEASSGDLAKKTQNPVSDLISIPFENNFGFGAGADGEFRYDLVIKPVIPMSLGEDWNWIHRVIVPVSSQPNMASGGRRNSILRALPRPMASAMSAVAPGQSFGEAWYLTSSPVITANWAADSDDAWTIPVGGGFGRVVRLGNLPVNVSLQGYYNIEKPDPAPDWTIRFQFAFLFPKG